jgi:hypothetical protein
MAGRGSPGPLTWFAAAVVPLLYAIAIRPRMRTWGATRDEIARRYPGDELIPGPAAGSTMATTLPAPPETVWRWLVQMGGDRGGWYSCDRLDNDGKPSARRVVAEWQELAEGQRLLRASVPGSEGPSFFTVEIVEPNRTLVLHAAYGMFTGRSFDLRADPVPWAYVDGIWGFHLRPTPSGRTRLVVRQRSRSGPRLVAHLYGLLLGQPVHFLMQIRQFHNLRARVTRQGLDPSPQSEPANRHRTELDNPTWTNVNRR